MALFRRPIPLPADTYATAIAQIEFAGMLLRQAEGYLRRSQEVQADACFDRINQVLHQAERTAKEATRI